MLKKLSYIFLLLSVTIILSHNIVAHHHHFETAATESQHHDDADDDHDHSIFSFGQLDETYLHSNDQIQLDNSFVCLFYVQPEFIFDLKSCLANRDFNIVEIFPPPDDPCYLSSNLRGPPIS